MRFEGKGRLTEDLLLNLGAGLAYWLTYLITWNLFRMGGLTPAPIWAAGGLAVALVYRFGWRPSLGLYAANLALPLVGLLAGAHGGADASWQLASLKGLTNTLAPLVVLLSPPQANRRRDPFSSLNAFFIFLLLAVGLHPALTAAGGTLSLIECGFSAPQAFLNIWTGWWLSDAIGTILFAPLCLLLLTPQTGRHGHTLEYLGLSAFTLIGALLIFHFDKSFHLGLPYLLIVSLALVAIRHSLLRSMLLFTLVVVAGLTSLTLMPSLKGEPIVNLLSFKIMAVTYSVMILSLAIIRRGQLQGETELSSSEAKYRRLAEKSPAVVYQFRMTPGGDFSFTYISETIQNLTGLSAAEVMQDARSLIERIHPDDHLSPQAGFVQAPAIPQPFQASFRLRQPDDQYRWVEIQAAPERQADGGILWDGLLIDVSERRQLENAYRESETRFLNLFQKSSDAVLLIEGERFVDCNAATLALLGCQREQVIGRHPAELSPTVQPDGRASREKAEEMMRLVQDKGSMHFEWQHLRANGTAFPAEITLTPFVRAGKNLIYCV